MPNRKSDRPETVKKETAIDTGADLSIDLFRDENDECGDAQSSHE
jgi:hypothetical protein